MDAIRKIEAALADVINEERPKFEKWAVSTEPLADVRAMAIHRKPDGQYSMLTARAGFAAWMGGALTEREQQAQILASKEAELVRLREALDEIAATRASEHGTAPMMIARCMKIARAALTQPPKEPT